MFDNIKMQKQKILIIGAAGGREHTLAWKIAQLFQRPIEDIFHFNQEQKRKDR